MNKKTPLKKPMQKQIKPGSKNSIFKKPNNAGIPLTQYTKRQGKKVQVTP